MLFNILIEVKSSDELGYYKNFIIASFSIEEAKRYIEQMYEVSNEAILSIEIEEFMNGDLGLDIPCSLIETGKSFFNIER